MVILNKLVVFVVVFCPPEPRVGAFVYRNAGKVYSPWNFVKVLFCKARSNFLLLIRKQEWGCRHCSDRVSSKCSASN